MIADRIAAAQADIEEFNGILNERNAALAQVTAAALQHGNDQQTLKDLQAKLSSLGSQLVTANDELLADAHEITGLQRQLSELQSTVTYPNQEWWPWGQNSNAQVGGSGLGTAAQKQADEKGTAWFSVTPNAPVAPATSNYFDCYYTHKFQPDASKKNYRLEMTWTFPTQTDANVANCLEMEVRQVLPGGAMFVPALQARFGDQKLHYFDHGQTGDRWVATAIAVPRFTANQPVTIVLEAHRDDTTVYYDAVTINGTRYPLNVTAPSYNDGWGERLSNSLQLDAKTQPFKVIPSGVSLEVR